MNVLRYKKLFLTDFEEIPKKTFLLDEKMNKKAVYKKRRLMQLIFLNLFITIF